MQRFFFLRHNITLLSWPPDEVPKGKTSDISNVSKLIIINKCLIYNIKLTKGKIIWGIYYVRKVCFYK